MLCIRYFDYHDYHDIYLRLISRVARAKHEEASSANSKNPYYHPIIYISCCIAIIVYLIKNLITM